MIEYPHRTMEDAIKEDRKEKKNTHNSVLAMAGIGLSGVVMGAGFSLLPVGLIAAACWALRSREKTQ
jgi:hypothetical protein